MKRLLLPLALLWLAALPALAQEAGVTNRATEMKAEPRPDAVTVAALPEGAKVKATTRERGWARVETPQGAGWVRVFHLRFEAVATQSSENSGGSFLSFLRGPPKTQSNRTATIGVRGLSEEELKDASPDPEALKRLQGWRVDKGAGDRFARDGRLAAVSVDYADTGKGGRK